MDFPFDSSDSNFQTEYRTVSFAGYIGVLTGEKINAYTVSFDQKRKETGKSW